MEKIKILILDDEFIDREILKNILHQFDFDIFELSDGSELEEFLKNIVPDLVITDWYMNIKNGDDVIKTIKAVPAHKHIPIMVVTSIKSDSHVALALSLGADHYIEKDSLDLIFPLSLGYLLQSKYREYRKDPKWDNFDKLLKNYRESFIT